VAQNHFVVLQNTKYVTSRYGLFQGDCRSVRHEEVHHPNEEPSYSAFKTTYLGEKKHNLASCYQARCSIFLACASPFWQPKNPPIPHRYLKKRPGKARSTLPTDAYAANMKPKKSQCLNGHQQAKTINNNCRLIHNV
jgi:hypothetical protein